MLKNYVSAIETVIEVHAIVKEISKKAEHEFEHSLSDKLFLCRTLSYLEVLNIMVKDLFEYNIGSYHFCYVA
jgi:hypothetical protein